MYYECHNCGLIFNDDECTTYTDYEDGIVCPACGIERAGTDDIIERLD